MIIARNIIESVHSALYDKHNALYTCLSEVALIHGGGGKPPHSHPSGNYNGITADLEEGFLGLKPKRRNSRSRYSNRAVPNYSNRTFRRT